jgi:hypothetical protein
MSDAPVPDDPRDRVISVTVGVLSLVLGVLPLGGLVFAVVRRSLHRQSGMPLASFWFWFLPEGLSASQ